jgi:hypothetical protein
MVPLHPSHRLGIPRLRRPLQRAGLPPEIGQMGTLGHVQDRHNGLLS